MAVKRPLTPAQQQFGNKKAIGNKGGTPRKTSFPPDEMIELGKEMVEWVKINNPLHLSEWYTIHKMFLYEEWKCFIRMPEFRPYYEQALKLVGLQYLDRDSRIRDGISQRWQRVYFKDLKEEEDDEKDADAERKKGIAVNDHANLILLAKLAAEGKISQKD